MRTLLDMIARRYRAPDARPKDFSLIDFGADTVKAVVVRRERTGVRVLGYGFAPAEGHDLSGGRADVAALAAIADEALVAAEDQTATTRRGKVVPDDALFCIPAWLARGECFTVRQTRPDPTAPITDRELKGVWERIERLAKERLPLLGEDSVSWKPLSLTPGAITVDGRRVTDPVRLKGRELSLSAFGVAVWPPVLRAVEAVAQRLELALVEVVAAPSSLASIGPRRDAILLDVGHKGTSVTLVQRDTVTASLWQPQGGEFFTQSLARAFRCSPEEAEALKRAYTDQALSTADADLVTRTLSEPVAAWLEMLATSLRQMTAAQANRSPETSLFDTDRTDSLPGRIYLTGGGSLLPDLSRALFSLESNAALPFRRSVEVESLGRWLSARSPGRSSLLDAPPYPVVELLVPALSLAACLE